MASMSQIININRQRSNIIDIAWTAVTTKGRGNSCRDKGQPQRTRSITRPHKINGYSVLKNPIGIMHTLGPVTPHKCKSHQERERERERD